MEDSPGPGLELVSKSVGAPGPIKINEKSSATVSVPLNGTGASLTGVTITVIVATVDLAGSAAVPVSVPVTWKTAVPKKFAAGTKLMLPPTSVTVPLVCAEVTMFERVMVCEDSSGGPGEKISVGVITNGLIGSSATENWLPMTTGGSFTGVTVIETVPTAVSPTLFVTV